MKKEQLAIKNIKQETHLFRSRCFAALIFISIFSLILIVRLAYLQIKNHRFYSTLSQHNLLTIIPIQPNRGLIFDRNGVILAKNIPIYTLAILPQGNKNTTETIKRLNKIIPISPEEIKRFHRISYQYTAHQPIPLKYKLTTDELARFYVNQYHFPEVRIKTQMMRYYPLGEITSDVLGYVSHISPKELQNKENANNYITDDDIGKTGIEKYYEKELHGTIGAQEVETDASGHVIRVLKEVPPTDGENLYLTIDSKLQEKANEVLGKESGAIVVMQPDTGQVLALVTKPSFDPNLFVSGLSQQNYQKLLNSPLHPLYNRAVSGQFAAGSTIKPFMAILGLEEKIITPDSQIYDQGWFQLPKTQHIYHDWRPQGHGWVNLAKAIAASCDVYFYNLAVTMGIDRMGAILHKFGFGKLTGIDLPEEVPGLVPSPSWKMGSQAHPWYTGDTIETGIGQGFFLVTPIQLAQAIAIIAERGKRYQPTLLLKSVAPNGNEKILQPTSESSVILKNPQIWETIIRVMQDVTDKPWGTARYFGPHPKFTVAAKTGTAQVYGHQRDENLTRTNIPKRLRNNHLIIAFAPVKHPQLAIAIVVEHSAMADKMAGEIMNYYFRNRE